MTLDGFYMSVAFRKVTKYEGNWKYDSYTGFNIKKKWVNAKFARALLEYSDRNSITRKTVSHKIWWKWIKVLDTIFEGKRTKGRDYD